MISNQPRPTSISEELRDYYLRHEKGRKLLVGVKIVSNEEAEETGAGSSQEEVSILDSFFADTHVFAFGRAR